MVERPEQSAKPVWGSGTLAPEPLAMKLSAMGQEKDRFLGALHNRIANWGAGFLDFNFGFMWGGFRRYAMRQRQFAREHFREFLEKNPPDKKNLP